ncbi:tail fiber protein [bacterium]|nr:tail fiber protein [bacterium]
MAATKIDLEQINMASLLSDEANNGLSLGQDGGLFAAANQSSLQIEAGSNISLSTNQNTGTTIITATDTIYDDSALVSRVTSIESTNTSQATAISELQTTITGLTGAMVYLGDINESTADVTQVKLNNRMVALGKNSALQGYTIVDSDGNDWVYDATSSQWRNIGYQAIPVASTTTPGIVQLNDSISSTSTSQAATANAVKTAYDLAASKGTGTITQVKANGTSVATSGVANIPAASTSAYGVTKLSSSTSSTSTALAATASAVKAAYDRGSTGVTNAATAQSTAVAAAKTFDNMIWNETPSGTKNGTNKTFTIANTPVATDKIHFKMNGVELTQGSSADYTVSSTTLTITANYHAPESTDTLTVSYEKAS